MVGWCKNHTDTTEQNTQTTPKKCGQQDRKWISGPEVRTAPSQKPGAGVRARSEDNQTGR